MTKMDMMDKTVIARIVEFCISMELPLELVGREIDSECGYTHWVLTRAGYDRAEVDTYVDNYREQLWDAYYIAMQGREAPPYDPDKMYYPF